MLVDQIQIQIIQSQLFQRSIDGFLCTLIACVLHPELCGDEQLFPRHTAFGNCRTHCLFVKVCGSGIDQPIACGDGIGNCLLTNRSVRHLEHTKAFQRHFYAIVQRYKFHFGFLPSLYFI